MIYKNIEYKIWSFQYRNKSKIFGIGQNKTGTTSLKVAMENLGYRVGRQRPAEEMIRLWKDRKFNAVISFCKTAEFFQDVPFSQPFTYVALDQAFPKSKFILTIRDNPEQWYASLTNFHAKKWGKNGRIPTKEDLLAAEYIYKGWAWDFIQFTFNSPEEDPYNKKVLINVYEMYNKQVLEYFRYRKNDLLVINVSNPGAHKLLCEFLGKASSDDDFPWVNKTIKIK